jgi:dipeptidyl aminopeptidase/acylaminoacyl peptidase
MILRINTGYDRTLPGHNKLDREGREENWSWRSSRFEVGSKELKMKSWLSVCFLLAANLAFAQLTPEQALQVRQIGDLRMSPDGRFVAFTVTEPVKGTDRDSNLYLLNVETRQIRQLTFSPKNESSPRWKPDGRALAFLSDREGPSQVYLLPMDGGEGIRLTEGKHSIQSFEWSPDGRRISFLAAEPRSDAEDKKLNEKDDARVVDKDNRLARLWVFDIESKKVTKLTSAPWRVSDVNWKSAGDGFLVIASNQPEKDLPTNRIYSIPLAGGEPAEIFAPRGGQFGQLMISPDGKLLAWVGPRVDGPTATDLFIRPIAGGEARNLTASVDRPFETNVWLKDGSIVSTVQRGFKTGFYRISADGKPEGMPPIDVNAGRGFAAVPGKTVFAGQTAVQQPEIHLWDEKGKPEKISRFNQSWEKISLTTPEFFTFRSFDGVEIEGSLLKPADSTTKLPLITLVHGGPAGRWQDAFEPWGQMLVSRGYAIFYANIRGSTGYGQKFLESNRADWGGGDFKDLMAGIDSLIQKGIADPERLGIGGWSYGGYMSMWAVTQTNRFKASVAGAGLSDLASEFGTENSSIYDEWYFGTPYERLDGFIRCSPITYIKNIRTPTLILQGEADTTDPIGQSQQFYRGAKRYGAPADLVLYPREGHGIREEKHMLDMYRRILGWYEKYLGNKP